MSTFILSWFLVALFLLVEFFPPLFVSVKVIPRTSPIYKDANFLGLFLITGLGNSPENRYQLCVQTLSAMYVEVQGSDNLQLDIIQPYLEFKIQIRYTNVSESKNKKWNVNIIDPQKCNNLNLELITVFCSPTGVLGIKVKIMLPWDPSGKIGPRRPLPDHVSIVEPKDEAPPPHPYSEQKGAKPAEGGAAAAPPVPIFDQ